MRYLRRSGVLSVLGGPGLRCRAGALFLLASAVGCESGSASRTPPLVRARGRCPIRFQYQTRG